MGRGKNMSEQVKIVMQEENDKLFCCLQLMLKPTITFSNKES